MPQSQDIHLNDSNTHRGQIARTAACPGKHLDACICCEKCMRQAHASLAQEMHAPKCNAPLPVKGMADVIIMSAAAVAQYQQKSKTCHPENTVKKKYTSTEI